VGAELSAPFFFPHIPYVGTSSDYISNMQNSFRHYPFLNPTMSPVLPSGELCLSRRLPAAPDAMYPSPPSGVNSYAPESNSSQRLRIPPATPDNPWAFIPHEHFSQLKPYFGGLHRIPFPGTIPSSPFSFCPDLVNLHSVSQFLLPYHSLPFPLPTATYPDGVYSFPHVNHSEGASLKYTDEKVLSSAHTRGFTFSLTSSDHRVNESPAKDVRQTPTPRASVTSLSSGMDTLKPLADSKQVFGSQPSPNTLPTSPQVVSSTKNDEDPMDCEGEGEEGEEEGEGRINYLATSSTIH